MDEDKLQTALHRAQRAERLLGDEMFVEAFAELKADCIAAWERTEPIDVAARESLWLTVNTLAKVKAYFVSAVDGGKMAKAELQTRDYPR